MDRVLRVPSPLGDITLASDGEGLTGLWFDGQRHFGSTLPDPWVQASDPVLERAAAWVEVYFSGGIPDFTPPLALRGTAFQRAVWDAVRTIPYGQCLSYGALAARLARARGGPVSPRAVGGAVGRNPVALIVPCHRVVAAGGLGGYAGGAERKRWLLDWEERALYGA